MTRANESASGKGGMRSLLRTDALARPCLSAIVGPEL
jgi:hypothetical protein